MTEGGGCDTGVPVQTKPKRSATALKEAAEEMLADAEVLIRLGKRLRKAAKKALCEAERATKPKASKCLVTGGVAPYGLWSYDSIRVISIPVIHTGRY